MLNTATAHARHSGSVHQADNSGDGSQYDSRKKGKAPDGQMLENFYWEKKPLGGRVVTVAEVIDTYRKDTTSLRPGYFLQRLCLQRVPVMGKHVNPDEVIAEFARKRDKNERCQYAIATFTATCFWRKLPLKGQPITPESVLAEFPNNPKGRLARGRFKSECWQQQLSLHRRPVVIDEIIKDYRAGGAILELAMVLKQCCLDGHFSHRPTVSPDVVANTYPKGDTGRLGLARFMADCFQHGLQLNGKPVSPVDVVKCFPYTPLGMLGRARFKQECCLKMIPLDGKKISPDAVVGDFPNTPLGRLALARFKQECCIQGLPLFGRPVLPETVLKECPNDPHGRLAAARFLGDCCLQRIRVDGKLVKAETVVWHYEANNAQLELGRFLADCYLQAVPLHGQPVSPADVIQVFQGIKAELELARFKNACCVHNLTINNRPVTPDEVIRAFPDNRLGKLARARFKAHCCKNNLLVAGQPVTPQTVITEYQAIGARLELAYFMEDLCLLGIYLNGQAILPETVLDWFPNSCLGHLGAAHFKQKCCLNRLPVRGEHITPDQVIEALNALGSGMDLAHFKEECCLRGLPLAGQPVTAAAVLTEFPNHLKGILSAARFQSECCLRGIPMDGKLIPPEVVWQACTAARGQLERARFIAECCLRGLSLFDQRVTTEAVVQDFPMTRDGKQGMARFLANCCLQGLYFNNRLVAAQTVVRMMEEAGALLDLARFKSDCCLRELRIEHKRLLPDDVLASFPQHPEGRLGQVRFKEQCYFKGFKLNAQFIQPEEVLEDYLSVKGRLNELRFRERCCLDNITLYARSISPEAVYNSYGQGGWQLEQAVFLTHLANDAKPLNGSYLTDEQVLAAFNNVPGNHSVRQVRYLIQRLNALPELDCCAEAMDIWQKAWQLNRNAPIKDEHNLYQQCLLRFLAMHHGLMVDGQPQSVDQVWQSIATLRDSFRTTRLRFFFLNYCGNNSLLLNGQPVQHEHVIACLNALLTGSKLHFALSQWYREHNSWTQAPSPPQPGQPERVELSPLVCATLSIVQDINAGADQPALLITGSFSRYLQGLCTTFNDIDIIGTAEAVQLLIGRLTGHHRGADEAPLPCQVSIWPIAGCADLRLPAAFNIVLGESDLGTKSMGIQASICPTRLSNNALAVHLPDDERALMCLPFAREVQMMNETLQYLIETLDSLSERLSRQDDLIIPRTIVFNTPKNASQRVCGLLMRCLLTLNKAREFAALMADHSDTPATTLRAYSRSLRAMVQNHSHRTQLVAELTTHTSSDQISAYQGKKCAFIRSLLNIIENPEELF